VSRGVSCESESATAQLGVECRLVRLLAAKVEIGNGLKHVEAMEDRQDVLGEDLVLLGTIAETENLAPERR
jgi:hypothetical protein